MKLSGTQPDNYFLYHSEDFNNEMPAAEVAVLFDSNKKNRFPGTSFNPLASRHLVYLIQINLTGRCRSGSPTDSHIDDVMAEHKENAPTFTSRDIE